MNLPPKLLARLKKRGINIENKADEKEEIFAENYDDDNKVQQNNDIKDFGNDIRYIVYEVANCPNLTNPYHKCVEYCIEKYEKKKFQPDVAMIKKRNKMLRKYPLPPNWIEVADPCTNRFYYWNTKKDEVSWLSPSHPRSLIRLPKDKVKSINKSTERVKERLDKDYSRERRRRRHSSSESRSSSSNRSRSSNSGDERRSSKHRSRKEKSKRKDEKKKQEDPSLDPMDPAAYSDVPRGTWKTGLDVRGLAKTGVDSTASGPLFQQRPYPSPSEILRQNAMLENKQNDDNK